MRYFIVNTFIQDGQYEYVRQSAVAASSGDEAIEVEDRRVEDAIVEPDYRDFSIEVAGEITEDEYNIVNMHLYREEL